MFHEQRQWSAAESQKLSLMLQVDTPGKKFLVGVAVTYVLMVLLVPTANIFIQVGSTNRSSTCLPAYPLCSVTYAH
jgi:hypothetical protein